MHSYWPFINPFDEASAEIPLLRDAFEDWKIGYGIFDALESIGVTLPWAGHADSIILDIEYFGNRSGGKFSSPVVLNLLGSTETLTQESREILARIIWTKFGEPWNHLWATNSIAYNPIHNYNMTDSRRLVKGESESRLGNGESHDVTEHGRGTDVTERVAGMNNTDSKGKVANTTESRESGQTSVDGTNDRRDDSVRASNEVETTTRSGNIGVTTTQQMLSSERELWMWNFFDQVYKDVDSVLALPFYDPCRI